jgi:hypothetical protein
MKRSFLNENILDFFVEQEVGLLLQHILLVDLINLMVVEVVPLWILLQILHFFTSKRR